MSENNVNVREHLHHKERSRFLFVIIFIISLAIIPGVVIYEGGAAAAAGLLVVVAVPVLSVWIFLEVAKKKFMGRSIRVGPENFPEIYQILLSVKKDIGYDKEVKVFIVGEDSVNALLSKFFRTKFIVLHSGLAQEFETEDGRKQIEFIIARFIGSLKAKHYRFNVVEVIVNSIEKVPGLNIPILSYERAVQYSGDQIGLATCMDLENSIRAFHRMLIGNKMSGSVNPQAILSQSREVSGFFGLLARLFSSHPHMVDRYRNIIRFAKAEYPNLYQNYVNGRGESLAKRVEVI